ncbi:MAG: hypothetical protein QOK16_4234 [Solirubrobacteraceae bacterium]|jgi:hypothetical protein|nr:hypothetical protein [Solirubrobacteraceae bacterium]
MSLFHLRHKLRTRIWLIPLLSLVSDVFIRRSPGSAITDVGRGGRERWSSSASPPNHVANILAKLGVHSQLQALLVAIRYGIVDVR